MYFVQIKIPGELRDRNENVTKAFLNVLVHTTSVRGNRQRTIGHSYSRLGGSARLPIRPLWTLGLCINVPCSLVKL